MVNELSSPSPVDLHPTKNVGDFYSGTRDMGYITPGRFTFDMNISAEYSRNL